jgi:hypothetical protein
MRAIDTTFVMVTLLVVFPSSAPAQAGPVGRMPPAEATPRVEFAFEERVTIDPATVLGETVLGHRQFIPITGGTVAGPKFNGQVLPFGFDFQLTYSKSDCTQLSASYFLKADDGAVIHVFNEGLVCPQGPRTIFRPRIEAPKGPYEWMTRATFVATLDLEPPAKAPPPGTPPTVEAVRIRIYQVL